MFNSITFVDYENKSDREMGGGYFSPTPRIVLILLHYISDLFRKGITGLLFLLKFVIES